MELPGTPQRRFTRRIRELPEPSTALAPAPSWSEPPSRWPSSPRRSQRRPDQQGAAGLDRRRPLPRPGRPLLPLPLGHQPRPQGQDDRDQSTSRGDLAMPEEDLNPRHAVIIRAEERTSHSLKRSPVPPDALSSAGRPGFGPPPRRKRRPKSPAAPDSGQTAGILPDADFSADDLRRLLDWLRRKPIEPEVAS